MIIAKRQEERKYYDNIKWQQYFTFLDYSKYISDALIMKLLS